MKCLQVKQDQYWEEGARIRDGGWKMKCLQVKRTKRYYAHTVFVWSALHLHYSQQTKYGVSMHEQQQSGGKKRRAWGRSRKKERGAKKKHYTRRQRSEGRGVEERVTKNPYFIQAQSLRPRFENVHNRPFLFLIKTVHLRGINESEEDIRCDSENVVCASHLYKENSWPLSFSISWEWSWPWWWCSWWSSLQLIVKEVE